MKPINKMTQAEVGAYVQSHLRQRGINVVLSGGAAVGIYSKGIYVSQDLDMVREWGATRKAIAGALEEIGFIDTRARYFKHADSEHLIEFPPGPLMVGAEPVRRVNEIKLSTGILRIVSPTDCVKDRLATYYHFKDRQGLIQAIMVAKENEVDLEEIRNWSQSEGKLGEFTEFLLALEEMESNGNLQD
jgi:hypothetical protein